MCRELKAQVCVCKCVCVSEKLRCSVVPPLRPLIRHLGVATAGVNISLHLQPLREHGARRLLRCGREELYLPVLPLLRRWIV